MWAGVVSFKVSSVSHGCIQSPDCTQRDVVVDTKNSELLYLECEGHEKLHMEKLQIVAK